MHPRVISFHYTLKDEAGKQLDTSKGEDPITFLEQASQILPGLETALKGLTLKVGDCQEIHVQSDDAYGSRNDELIFDVPLENLPKGGIKVGDRFFLKNETLASPLTVVSLNQTHATLDANHPLAGVNLTFEIEIVSVRDASKEEVEERKVISLH